MATITIDDVSIGAQIATGDGNMTSLALVTPGPFSPGPLALVDGRGAILFSCDTLNLIPIGNPIWGNLLSDYVLPFRDDGEKLPARFILARHDDAVSMLEQGCR